MSEILNIHTTSLAQPSSYPAYVPIIPTPDGRSYIQRSTPRGSCWLSVEEVLRGACDREPKKDWGGYDDPEAPCPHLSVARHVTTQGLLDGYGRLVWEEHELPGLYLATGWGAREDEPLGIIAFIAHSTRLRTVVVNRPDRWPDGERTGGLDPDGRCYAGRTAGCIETDMGGRVPALSPSIYDEMRRVIDDGTAVRLQTGPEATIIAHPQFPELTAALEWDGDRWSLELRARLGRGANELDLLLERASTEDDDSEGEHACPRCDQPGERCPAIALWYRMLDLR